MQKIVVAQENEIRQEVLNYRLKGIRRKKLDPQDVSKQLFDGKNTVEDFKRLGFIDEISTVHEVMAKEFGPGTKLLDLNLNTIASHLVRTSLAIN